jgi:hypothetical protein
VMTGPDLGGVGPTVPLVSGVLMEPIPWPSAAGVLDPVTAWQSSFGQCGGLYGVPHYPEVDAFDHAWLI